MKAVIAWVGALISVFAAYLYFVAGETGLALIFCAIGLAVGWIGERPDKRTYHKVGQVDVYKEK